MSIFPDELLIGAHGLSVDLHGYENVPDTVTGSTTVGDFLRSAVIGWDSGTSSYFIVGPEDDEGDPYYWFGNIPNIPSPYAIIPIINSLFGGCPEEFDGVFSDKAIHELIQERNSTVEFPEEFSAIDALWMEHKNIRIDLFGILFR